MNHLKTLASTLLLGACSQTGVQPVSEQLQTVTYPLPTRAWQCTTTGYVVSSIDTERNSLWLFIQQQTLELAATGPSNSYANAETSFTSDEHKAELTISGKPENCQENRRASIREDAKLRGVDFLATGNEPPWKLELGPLEALLYIGYERDLQRFELPAPETDQANRSTRYVLRNADAKLTIIIKGEPCRDSMSGEDFSASVRLLINGGAMNGCGMPLH